MITKLDGGHVFMPTTHAIDLTELLDHLADVLRGGGQELRDDIDDRYQPAKTQHLIETMEHHAELIRRAIRPSRRKAATQ